MYKLEFCGSGCPWTPGAPPLRPKEFSNPQVPELVSLRGGTSHSSVGLSNTEFKGANGKSQ